MRYYRLTPSRIKRIIRHPARIEEGILEGAIACMQPSSANTPGRETPRNYSEIWAMYLIKKGEGNKERKIQVITAWRYPGKSPERDPIPVEILKEVRALI